jgi:hypothetical protein
MIFYFDTNSFDVTDHLGRKSNFPTNYFMEASKSNLILYNNVVAATALKSS